MSKIYNFLWRYGPLFSLLLLIFVGVADDVWARAGGGGGFGGGGGGGSRGGSGGSGGYSGGSGNGADLVMLIYLLFEHPAIGVPVLIFVIIAVYLKGKEVNQRSTIRGNVARRREVNTDQIRGDIQEHDPEFSEEIFNARVKKAFLTAQDAWCEQKLEPIRPFVSDGIFERWSMQIKEQQDEGYRDFMSNINIGVVQMSQYDVSGNTEELTVRISASAEDYRVSLSDNERIAGSGSSGSFVEFWTFLRRKGAKTKPGAEGLMEGHCPNCGAEIGINQSANCEHCKAFLRSGEYDWVLTEISQDSVYDNRASEDIGGVSLLQESDAEFSPRMLEDRASVIYWRYMLALKSGESKPAKGCCSDECYSELCDKIKADTRVIFNNCAVGSVDTKGIIPARDFDTGLVEIIWSGEKVRLEAGKKGQESQKAIYRELYILKRKAGVKSVETNQVGSAHCPGCGAPESAGENGACRYCGTLLNDGSRNWVLSAVVSWASQEAQEYLTQLSTVSRDTDDSEVDDDEGPVVGEDFNVSAYSLMAWLVNIVVSDGRIDDREKLLLRKAAKARNISADLLAHMVDSALAGNLFTPMPQSDKEARLWMRSMVRMALSDGKITSDEMKLLNKVSERLEFGSDELREIIKEEKAALLNRK